MVLFIRSFNGLELSPQEGKFGYIIHYFVKKLKLDLFSILGNFAYTRRTGTVEEPRRTCPVHHAFVILMLAGEL